MSEAADGFGAIATASLMAREIERAGRGAPASGHEIDEPCANCGTERVGPYCHACGQAGHLHRNMMALVHDIAHGVFHFEGKTWNTLPMLAWKPGELTRRYVHGERVKFVSPMALFLFSVFLMFAVLSNFGHHGTSETPHKSVAALTKTDKQKQKLATEIMTLKAVRATTPAAAEKDLNAEIAKAEKDLKALSVPGQVQSIVQPKADGSDDAARSELRENGFNTGLGWFDRLVSHYSKNPELAAYKLKTYGYKYSWALIPISLPFIWLLFFWRRDVGMYDHAIFSIYSLTFMSLAVVVLAGLSMIGVSGPFLWLIAMIVAPIHMYRQLKGAYLLGRWGALWRTFALLIITTITSSLFLSFLVWMGSD